MFFLHLSKQDFVLNESTASSNSVVNLMAWSLLIIGRVVIAYLVQGQVS